MSLTAMRSYFKLQSCAAGMGLLKAPQERRPVPHGMALVGHRGASARKPENTMAAMRQAWHEGAQGVEFDLQQLADGNVVMLHDETLRRTAVLKDNMAEAQQQGLLDTNVAELTWDSVCEVDVGGEGLAHFEQVLAEAKTQPAGVFCLAELKRSSSKTLVQNVIEATEASQCRPCQIVFISFSAEVCVQLKKSMPTFDVLLIETCYTEESAISLIEKAERLGLSGVDFMADPRVVTPDVVSVAHQKGLLVGVWCFRHPAPNDVDYVWSAMHSNGVDLFTSNLPRDIFEWSHQVGATKGFTEFWLQRHASNDLGRRARL